MARAQGARVLLVEDDPEVVYVVCGMLAAHGYRVCHAPHSMAAFHILVTPDEALPQAVILDIGLPGVRGVAVLEFIRITMGSDLPVVVLTGVATPKEEARLRELGVSAFLRKPASCSTILSAVEEAVSGRSFPLLDSRTLGAGAHEEPETDGDSLTTT
jgi:DNA-binding response OmpR family regulator